MATSSNRVSGTAQSDGRARTARSAVLVDQLHAIVQTSRGVSSESHDPQVTPDSGAPDTVGRLLARRGDIGRAAAAYQLAIDSGNREEAPKAALFLGGLRAGQGDPVGAAAAYQLAAEVYL